ncbi:hypothetical protein BHECKSOX2_907 [Bathymodiolus heckerae thiotrophic gill symbiont]|nr:hypothetical protein [uncultured Gammaproteobacteria bacterium]SMN12753.1 hypothetical protein BHECKSOX2_907 [Bathymodiolus heckerae thiotrophic gill symbiont]
MQRSQNNKHAKERCIEKLFSIRLGKIKTTLIFLTFKMEKK